ncbi:MAG TPA: nucleotidyltransferase domain-containing protein [archaeon]|nr:nucleotidyltransferase domain-containing protein [archaeon]
MDKKVYMEKVPIEMEIIGLYLSNYKTKIHIREIARRINKNHRTVLLAVKRLEFAGIVNHEVVGKSKQYFLNLSNVIAKDYIRNAESIKTRRLLEKHFIFKKLLTEFSQSLMSTPVLLFGSYAKGEETKKSDIDMFIVKGKREKEIVDRASEFFSRHNLKLQVQKSTQEEFEMAITERDNLAVEILKNHIILNNVELFVDIFWRYYGK